MGDFMNSSLTALFCLYAKAYHQRSSLVKIYDDIYSEKLINQEEYETISNNLKNNIDFFNNNYKGINPLEWIVYHQIAPSILARSAFCQQHLKNELNLGLKQYVILASGYDTSGINLNKKIKVFEIDKKSVIEDKLKRIKQSKINVDNIRFINSDLNTAWINDLINSGYNQHEKSLFSLLGITYYLEKEKFLKLLQTISENTNDGSSIVFDYPNKIITEKELKNKKLAESANEQMVSNYSYNEIEQLAEKSGFLIYEHLISKDIDNMYFKKFNQSSKETHIKAPKGVSYCLLVKRNKNERS